MKAITEEIESVRYKLEFARRYQQEIDSSNAYTAIEQTIEAVEKLTELVERMGKSLAAR